MLSSHPNQIVFFGNPTSRSLSIKNNKRHARTNSFRNQSNFDHIKIPVLIEIVVLLSAGLILLEALLRTVHHLSTP